MTMRVVLLCLAFLTAALPASAQDVLGLSAPDEVVDSGLLKFILPRFSLKTGIRVQPDPNGTIIVAKDPPGEPVFKKGDTIYYLRVDDSAKHQRFRDWLTSDIGKRTIDSFQIDGAAQYSSSFDVAAVAEVAEFEGDALQGEKLSLTHCGRCHVVSEKNKQNGIGSTPSFAVLRSLADWDSRFQQFYVLAPHGAFTQIEDVTEPFDPERPSPIVPVELTPDDVDAILAYVQEIKPADLGKPIDFQ